MRSIVTPLYHSRDTFRVRFEFIGQCTDTNLTYVLLHFPHFLRVESLSFDVILMFHHERETGVVKGGMRSWPIFEEGDFLLPTPFGEILYFSANPMDMLNNVIPDIDRWPWFWSYWKKFTEKSYKCSKLKGQIFLNFTYFLLFYVKVTVFSFLLISHWNSLFWPVTCQTFCSDLQVTALTLRVTDYITMTKVLIRVIQNVKQFTSNLLTIVNGIAFI